MYLKYRTSSESQVAAAWTLHLLVLLSSIILHIHRCSLISEAISNHARNRAIISSATQAKSEYRETQQFGVLDEVCVCICPYLRILHFPFVASILDPLAAKRYYVWQCVAEPPVVA